MHQVRHGARPSISCQKKIKVKAELIPHIGLIRKVIPLQLFLVVVLNSFHGFFSRAVRGQLKRLHAQAFVYIMCKRKPSNAVGRSSLILKQRSCGNRSVLKHFGTLIGV